MRALFLVALFATVTPAAGPLARLSPEQVGLLDKRDGFLRQAQKAQGEGDWKTAAARLEQALRLQEQIFGEASFLAAVTADLLGDARVQTRDWAGAAGAYRKVRLARARLLGEGHWQAVDAGVSERNARAMARLGPDERRAVEQAGRRLQEAVRLYRSGRPDEGIRLAKASADAYAKHLGADNPFTLSAQNNLAMLHQQAGDYKAALPLLRSALAARRKALGTTHPLYAISLNNLAQQYRLTGDDLAALPLARESLAVRRRVFGEDHPSTAQGINNLAVILQGVGQQREALRLLARAAELYRRGRGPRHPDYATALSNQATVHLYLGEANVALPLLERAVAIQKAALGAGHPRTAEALFNLTAAYREFGDARLAVATGREAVAAMKRSIGAGHRFYALALVELAAAHQARAEDADALPLLREALDVQRRNPGRRHPEYALTLLALAHLRSDTGKPREAVSLCEEALGVLQARLGPGHPTALRARQNLAACLMDAGDYSKGLAALKGLPGPVEYEALHTMAVAYRALGRPSAALPLAEAALRRAAGKIQAEAAVGSERQQLAALGRLRVYTGLRLSLPDNPGVSSYPHVLACKGAVFAAQRRRRLFVRLGQSPEARDEAARLLATTRRLAQLASRPDDAEAKRMTALKEQLERSLAGRSEAFRRSRRPATPQDVQAALPEGVALVDFLHHYQFAPPRPGERPRTAYHITAWVSKRQGQPVRVPLGPSAPVLEALASWRDELEKGRVGAKHAALLREKVWQPLEKHLAGAKVVLVSPDGALAGLPWGALPGSKRGTYLLEERAIAVVPVPRLLPEQGKPPEGKASLLAVGGVEFGKPAAGEGKDTWQALPATAAEAGFVAGLFRKALAGPALSLSGKRATSAALREALPRHRFAHLATHGFFAPGMDGRVRLERLFVQEADTGWHPGLLSGVVLAGANTAADDGVLTALEIAEMDLSGMELAVLSACQTGLGKQAAHEALLGLQRAFAVAGCKSVVSSLWSVHDAATGVLMERFYHHLWRKKLSKLEALRQAQLDVLRHPEWVEERVKELGELRGLRGVGKVSEKLVAGKKQRRSPVAWWAAWQLSGDWR